MTKFKVGDKVKIITDYYFSLPKNSIQTISRVEYADFGRILYYIRSSNSGHLTFREDWLIPVNSSIIRERLGIK